MTSLEHEITGMRERLGRLVDLVWPLAISAAAGMILGVSIGLDVADHAWRVRTKTAPPIQCVEPSPYTERMARES